MSRSFSVERIDGGITTPAPLPSGSGLHGEHARHPLAHRTPICYSPLHSAVIGAARESSDNIALRVGDLWEKRVAFDKAILSLDMDRTRLASEALAFSSHQLDAACLDLWESMNHAASRVTPEPRAS